MFEGYFMNPSTLTLLSDARSRSISAENPTGERDMGALATSGTGEKCARDLGKGWKISPSYRMKPGEVYTMAEIDGSGVINSMWITGTIGRDVIIRMYWDHQEKPSVECPLTDFFACGWYDNSESIFDCQFDQLNSLMVCVNPNRALNCFWQMPFRTHAKITLENRNPEKDRVIYYQVNYALCKVPEEAAYFHAQFRRTNPVPFKEDYVILDHVAGKGHYVGTSLSVGLNGLGKWWGEGEIKFFLDGEKNPTICGTGTEDYFLGAFDWDVSGQYTTYNSLYGGMYHVEKPDGMYKSQQRFSMYRWHVLDPVRFDSELKVTIQDLGWYKDWRYQPRQDDFASVAYWYQTLPSPDFPALPEKDALEIT